MTNTRDPVHTTCMRCGAAQPGSLDDVMLYGISMAVWIDDARILKVILDVMNEYQQDPDLWADLQRRAKGAKQ